MKKYTKQQLAKGYLALRAHSPKQAVFALAAALISQRAVREVDLVVQAIQRLRLQQTGEAHVRITTARPLSPKHRRALSALVGRLSGAVTVHADYSVDPSLHGGFLATTPTAEIDGSVQGLLTRLTHSSVSHPHA